jgi:hypothetical protein
MPDGSCILCQGHDVPFPKMPRAYDFMRGPYHSCAGHQLVYEGQAQLRRGYQTFSAPAPAPVVIGQTNAMVQRVDTAYAKAQKTPQLSFGQDGVTVQQPVVSSASFALDVALGLSRWASAQRGLTSQMSMIQSFSPYLHVFPEPERPQHSCGTIGLPQLPDTFHHFDWRRHFIKQHAETHTKMSGMFFHSDC